MWMLITKYYSLVILVFALFSAFIDGRSLQQKYSTETLNLSTVVSTNNISPLKAVSFATDSTYNGTTYYNDVLGVAKLCVQYSWLLERGDDPCFPSSFSWLRCNSDSKPRIISLNLNSMRLLGELPDFSTMDALQSIDISDNLLSGTIPAFLGTFPRLQQLDLSNNLFSGPIPNSLVCNKNLDVSVSGNINLDTPTSCSKSTSDALPPSTASSRDVPADSSSDTGSFQVPATRSRSKKKKSVLPVILGCAISVFVLFWVASGIFMMYRHKTKSTAAVAEAASTPGQEMSKGQMPMEEMPMKNATNNVTSP